MRYATPPTYTLNFNEAISCFEICGTDFAYNLVCIGCDEKIILGVVQFPEEAERFDWVRMKDLYNGSRCHAICFAPETSLVTFPKTVTVCTASADFRLRIYRTDLQDDDTVQKLRGHTSYVNDIAWVCDGEYLASVSDDHTCKIWNVESNYENVTTFCLSSCGMSVKWHPEDPHKVMVAEKKGIVHLYNVHSQQAIISVESPKFPLMSADWALNNRLFIAALAAGDIVVWDLSRPCAPTDVKQVHEDGGRVVRFSPNTSELVVASVGRPDVTLKVFSAKSSIPLVEAPLKTYGGLAWHQRLPYIGASFDRKLCFWKVMVK